MQDKSNSQNPTAKSNMTRLSWMLIAYCLLPIVSSAQCAMCRASLESTSDQPKAEAINDGIVFLMAIPYILVAAVGVVIYRMYSKRKAEN